MARTKEVELRALVARGPKEVLLEVATMMIQLARESQDSGASMGRELLDKQGVEKKQEAAQKEAKLVKKNQAIAQTCIKAAVQ